MRYFIASDCGGTKSTFMLCDLEGHVLQRETGGTANAHFENEETILQKLIALVQKLKDGSGVDPDRVEALGGVFMIGPTLPAFSEAVRGLFPNCMVRTLNECNCNLVASTGGFEGTIAHSGTGSFGYAVQDGREFNYGGLGSYIGDEGSGYNIGIHTFMAVKNALAGLGPETVLTEMIFKEWKVDSTGRFITVVTSLASNCIAVNAESRLKIARLTRLTEQAAKQGDAVAKGILRRAAADMADHIRVLVNKEGLRPEGPLSVSGGSWRSGPDFLESFSSIMAKDYPGFQFIYPKTEPIGGCAAVLLKTHFGVVPTKAIFANLPGSPL